MNYLRSLYLPDSSTLGLHGPHPFLPDDPATGAPGAGGGGGAPAGQQQPVQPQQPVGSQWKPNGANGYPDATPLTEMSGEQREAYWRFHARKHEATANARGDYDQIKAERDRIVSANKPPEQQALDSAREEGRQAGMAAAAKQYGTQLVQGRFDALLADRVLKADGTKDDERRQALVNGLATGSYLKADGTVDVQALSSWADTIAPQPATGAPQQPGQPGPLGPAGQFVPGQPGQQQPGQQPGQWPSFGQGQTLPPPANAAQAGIAEAQRRFGIPQGGAAAGQAEAARRFGTPQ